MLWPLLKMTSFDRFLISYSLGVPRPLAFDAPYLLQLESPSPPPNRLICVLPLVPEKWVQNKNFWESLFYVHLRVDLTYSTPLPC